jgi:hypothetical protein
MALSAAYVCNQHFYEPCGVFVTHAAHVMPRRSLSSVLRTLARGASTGARLATLTKTIYSVDFPAHGLVIYRSVRVPCTGRSAI